METALIARPLDKDAIDRAYPLILNLAPGVTIERWTRFARPLVAARSARFPRGLMSIQTATGYVVGLFGFEVRDELRENRTLTVGNILVPNVPGRDWVWARMAEAIETLAKEHDCAAIRAELADDFERPDSDRDWVVTALTKSGYELDDVRAFKRLRRFDANPST